MTTYASTPNAPTVLKARKQRDLAVETGLILTIDEKKHIVYVLNSNYGRIFDVAPFRVWDSAKLPWLNVQDRQYWLNVQDRQYLRKYSKSAGHPESEYLTQAMADLLLKEDLPLVLNDKWGSGPRKTHDDWTSMVVISGKYCRILTNATSVSGWSPYFAPQMTFQATRSQGKSLLSFQMVKPNPYTLADSIYALVDGRRYKLQLKRGKLRPRSVGENLLSDDVMKAIRRGQKIEVISAGKDGKVKTKVAFSASGFTSAFNQMMKDCNRPGLSAWFR